MEEWIDSLIAAALAPVRTLVDSVKQRLMSIYTTLTTAFGLVRSAFGRWVDRTRRWANAQIRHALATANHLRWLATVDLPNRAAALFTQVRTWTSNLIASVVTTLRSELATVRTWVSSLVSNVASQLLAFSRWVRDGLAAIGATIARLVEHVFGPLASPERLATWAIGAIMGAAGRWIIANVERLAYAAWRHRRPIESEVINRTLSTIERIM